MRIEGVVENIGRTYTSLSWVPFPVRRFWRMGDNLGQILDIPKGSLEKTAAYRRKVLVVFQDVAEHAEHWPRKWAPDSYKCPL